MSYAAATSVPAEKSRAEIERLLDRSGARQFAYGKEEDRAMIQFRLGDRLIRFTLPLPDRQSREFTHTPTRGQRRRADDVQRAYEQAVRQRWRALLLIVKAKLEAVETGLVTLEDEFLAQMVLPDGSTVAEFMEPQLQLAAASGRMPHAMPALRPGD